MIEDKKENSIDICEYAEKVFGTKLLPYQKDFLIKVYENKPIIIPRGYQKSDLSYLMLFAILLKEK